MTLGNKMDRQAVAVLGGGAVGWYLFESLPLPSPPHFSPLCECPTVGVGFKKLF